MNLTNFEPPRYTYNDYKNWKEDWELVNGYPMQLLPSAIWKHSQALSRCNFQVEKSLEQNENCSCNVFIELDWKVNDYTVLRPDLMVVCDELTTDFLEFPPILIVEVLSPSTTVRDRTIKYEIYQSQGVKFYIMLDYIKKTAEIFELINNVYQQVDKSEVEIDKNCKINFDFEKIWKTNTNK